MNNRGIFGIPRLTSIAPFVNSTYSESKQKRKQLIQQLIVEERNKIVGKSSDINEEEALRIGKSVADRMFDPSVNNHLKEKNKKLKKCIDNDWANSWVEGMDEAVDGEYTNLEKMQMKMMQNKLLWMWKKI